MGYETLMVVLTVLLRALTMEELMLFLMVLMMVVLYLEGELIQLQSVVTLCPKS